MIWPAAVAGGPGIVGAGITRQEAIEAIKNAEMSPSEKRHALKKLGVQTEYMPHQGKRETERRKQSLEAIAQRLVGWR